MRSLTRDQLRAIDRYAIEQIGVPGLVLMENAGRQCADAIHQFLGDQSIDDSVAVVCGGGNNGGDGYVLARHLVLRGLSVTVFLTKPADDIEGDARVNLDILHQLDADVRDVSAEDRLNNLADQLKPFGCVVDAVGGTGLKGALRGSARTAAEQINAAGHPVVAVDIPTGLDCDTGQAEGVAVHAELTVTMVARKRGFDAQASTEFTGLVAVVDIGVPPELVARRAGVLES